MIDEEDTWKACAEVTKKDEKYLKALRQLLEVEKENPQGEWIGYKSPTGKAWEVINTPLPPEVISHFSRKGIVTNFYKTRSTKAFHIVNPKVVQDFVDFIERERNEVEIIQKTEKILNPDDMFEWISGYEPEKRWLKRWASKRIQRGDWEPQKGDPTVSMGVALTGPGGTAKSDFLVDSGFLPRAYYTTGTYISTAGLWDILYDGDYWFLVIDECDKMKGEDWKLLYTLLGNMFIQKDQYKRHYHKMMDVNVLVASNNWKKVSEAMQDRFREWPFQEYTLDEYLRNSRFCLMHRYGVDESLAEYIAEITSQFTRHVRTAIAYGVWCDDKDEVDDLYDMEMKRGVTR